MKQFWQLLILCTFALSQINCGLFRLYNQHRNLILGDSKDRQEMIVGGEIRMEVNNRHIKELLDSHLPRLITGDGDQFIIDEIVEVTRQVVAGVLYRVKGHYLVEGQKKTCTISILERNWLETAIEKIVISAKCDDGSCYVSESYTCSQKSLTFW